MWLIAVSRCGLVPGSLRHNLGNAHIELQLESIFAHNWPFENGPEMYFGGDASSADPRKRRVAFAVVALIKHSVTGAWQVVGCTTAKLPGQVQTVPLGEAFALLYCLKSTLNSFCLVIDAQYAYNQARKLSRKSVATFTHPDVTEAELSRDRPGRLKMQKIKSHLTREQWLAIYGIYGEDELWRWANRKADKLCTTRAATLAGKLASILQDWALLASLK